jgi:hypothetical protein
MRRLARLALAFWLIAPALTPRALGAAPREVRQGGYTLGPKGGCYTVTASGRKKYVDRSLCAGGDRGATEIRRFGGDTSGAGTPPRLGAGSASRYHRGPRGGCYTYTAAGNKKYVDRSLCQ